MNFDTVQEKILNVVDKSFDAINKTTEESKVALDNAQSDVERITKEANEMLAKVRDVALNKGVVVQANYFANEVRDHRAAAWNWLVTTFIAFILLLSAAIFSFFIANWYNPQETFSNIQLGISKFLLIGVLTYITIQCSKNYFSHKHNAEINQHRHNSILSYEHFINAAHDLEVKAAIVAYVAASVFTPQETGFVNAPVHIDLPKDTATTIINAMKPTTTAHP